MVSTPFLDVRRPLRPATVASRTIASRHLRPATVPSQGNFCLNANGKYILYLYNFHISLGLSSLNLNKDVFASTHLNLSNGAEFV
jgi:hypothetical protein